MGKNSFRITKKSVFMAICFILVMVWFLFPVYWSVIASLQPIKYLTSGFQIIPIEMTFDNYISLLGENQQFRQAVVNTLEYSLMAAFATTAIGSIGAYAFSRFRFKAKGTLFFVLWFGQIIPPFGILIPLYMLLTKTGLYDSIIGLGIVYTAFLLPFAVWLMKSFFDLIPIDLEEAAMIDGCSRWGAFTKVLLPMAIPGVVTAFIYAFIATWNDFVFALIFTAFNVRAVTVTVAEFVSELHYTVDMLVTGAVVAIIPPVVLALIFRKFIIKGLVEGLGIKG